ncbi:MAG TPA: sarcosine oxidase subunit gamma family protein [Gaiellaceae bacterium]|jgi:sarcosine oxidase subunit gamma|nr:sarcosine oxidase subunit gamma family protein [Gaiellaceae bacterium]
MAVLREVPVEAKVLVRGEPRPGFPLEPNTCAGDVLWLGPDEWLVLGAREADFADAAAAVDVSAARVVLELSGDDAREVLAQACSLDLRPASFGPGRCARTLVAQTEAILQCTGDDAIRLLVPPSFAPYLRAWLEDAIEGARR